MSARAALALAAALFAGPALADSCWTHNGSLMRLGANGEKRAFAYEVPRKGLADIGVKPGDTVFWGATDGKTYSGQAKVFSTECPGEATSYAVSGPVLDGGTRVVLSGQRRLYRACAPTGEFVADTLVFVYARQC
ncbi:MAG: hypothetical protein IPL88_13145 [Rhizobiales bacterium]|nr:hypothetical protein [Hyphomicrobiales bacterium]